MVPGSMERIRTHFFCYIMLVVRGSPTPHIGGEHHKWPTNGGFSYITPNPWGVPYTLQFQK